MDLRMRGNDIGKPPLAAPASLPLATPPSFSLKAGGRRMIDSCRSQPSCKRGRE
ncbi:MAG: hypothetical protein ACR2P4_04435 [Gammaproteobacteria bacterium]